MSRTSNRSLAVFVGLCIALALSVPLQQSAAATAEVHWGTPVALGPELSSSWFPDVAVDPSGAAYVVWEGTRATGGASAVFLSQLTPEGWSLPADIETTDGSYAGRTAIASDGRWVHVTYRKEMAPGRDVRLWYIRAPVAGDLASAHSWSAPQPISDDMAYYSQFVILPTGDIVCIFNQILPEGTDEGNRRTGLFARHSSDDGATWTTAVRISDTGEQVVRSGIVLSPDQMTLTAFWDEGYENMSGEGAPKRVGIGRSIDGGRTWTHHQAISSRLGPIEQGFVAYAADGPVLVYRSTVEDLLYFRASRDDGRTWSDEQAIPGTEQRPYTVHHFDRFSLASDGDRRVLLAYVGQDPTAPKGLAVMVASYDDGQWTRPTRVAAPDGYPEYPRLAVALGTQIHLVYFVRDLLYDAGNYTLWTIAGRTDAQPIPKFAPAPITLSPPTAVPAAVTSHRIRPYPTHSPPRPLGTVPGEQFATPLQVAARPATEALRSTLLALALLFPAALAVRYFLARRP